MILFSNNLFVTQFFLFVFVVVEMSDGMSFFENIVNVPKRILKHFSDFLDDFAINKSITRIYSIH